MTRNPSFLYKYVLLKDLTEFKGWERGMDRCADLCILPYRTQGSDGAKSVEIRDKWQAYFVRFSVFDPWSKFTDQLWLQSTSKQFSNVKMELQRQPEAWLKSRYGTPVNVWKSDLIEVSNESGDAKGQTTQNTAIEYFYTKGRG